MLFTSTEEAVAWHLRRFRPVVKVGTTENNVCLSRTGPQEVDLSDHFRTPCLSKPCCCHPSWCLLTPNRAGTRFCCRGPPFSATLCPPQFPSGYVVYIQIACLLQSLHSCLLKQEKCRSSLVGCTPIASRATPLMPLGTHFTVRSPPHLHYP